MSLQLAGLTIERLARVYCKCAPEELAGRCHFAACELKNALGHMFGVDAAKVQRGFWVGQDARRERRDWPFQQHSWVLRNGYILDPTQWVFTGDKPCIAVVRADDPRYDASGYRVRNAEGARNVPPREKHHVLTKSGLGALAQIELTDALGGRDWSWWSTEECWHIAHVPPSHFHLRAQEIYQALVAAGHKAMIPLDAWQDVMRSGNHA